MIAAVRYALFGLCLLGSMACHAKALLHKHQFTDLDAIYVADASGQALYQWQADKALIPASLTKLMTTYLALEKWGEKHRFHTDIYQLNNQLWIKGFGDPYLISEELDILSSELQRLGISSENTHSIWLDNHYFKTESVPGRSSVSDPYNAPLSAIAANFNTVQLRSANGKVLSAEEQTPLTATASRLASKLGRSLGVKPQRVNLRNAANAQQHFAEILAKKIGLNGPTVHINQRLPEKATLLYRHFNTRNLADNIRATLEYSNNFIANQLYLKLAETTESEQLSFAAANHYVKYRLAELLDWREATLFDGSGLSRSNRLSAKQIDRILAQIQPSKTLLKRIDSEFENVQVYAKTGTLDGVRSYAGFIESPGTIYRFVFIFNRQTAYGYRDGLLKELVKQLQVRQ